jgi:hypothetical protein
MVVLTMPRLQPRQHGNCVNNNRHLAHLKSRCTCQFGQSLHLDRADQGHAVEVGVCVSHKYCERLVSIHPGFAWTHKHEMWYQMSKLGELFDVLRPSSRGTMAAAQAPAKGRLASQYNNPRFVDVTVLLATPGGCETAQETRALMMCANMCMQL